MAGHNCHHTQRSTERERPDIAHKNHRGIGVEPQKTKPGASNRTAENHQFSGTRQISNIQVLSEFDVPREISDNAESRSDHDSGHDRQPVQPICQIHRIAGAHHDQIAEWHEQPAHRQRNIFKKWHV